MTSTTLPGKTPAERVYVDFDFTNLFNDGIRSGITIPGTPSLTIVARTGTDTPATLVVDGAGAIDSTGLIWSQRVKLGLAGVSYSLLCHAIGSNGSEQEIDLLLPVTDFRLG